MMTNQIQSYENDQQRSNQSAKVQQIMYENSAKNLAINGIGNKSVLYAILSILAVLELCAALFFYFNGVFAVPIFAAVSLGASVAIAYHYYLHAVLVSTCSSIAFERKHHSKAMKTETIINIVICLLLLLAAALTVCVLGRNGFAAYRSNQFEAKYMQSNTDSTRSNLADNTAILTKNGQLITERANALTALKAAENARNAQNNANNAQKRKEYDNQTVQLSNVVGTSAFFVELLLLLLAYSIATAKRAATIETESNEYIVLESSVTQNNAQNHSVTDSVTQTVTQPITQNLPENTQNIDSSVTLRLEKIETILAQLVPTESKRQIGFNKECKQCAKPILDAKSDRKEFCNTSCRIEFWKGKTGKELITK